MKKIIMLLALLAFTSPVLATDWYGEGAVGVEVDNTDLEIQDSKFSTSLDYLGLGMDSETFSFYGILDNVETSSEFTFMEMYGTFNMFDTDFSIGRVFVPMGVNMKFDRPTASVFLSTPRSSTYSEGLTATVYDDVATVEGFFSSEDSWSMRAEMQFIDGGIIPSVTLLECGQADVEQILACEMVYESLVFNANIMGEYWIENEEAWMRGVITPGIFDRVAVFGGYYDTEFVKDTFTYGLSVEINEGVEVSTEWSEDTSFTPLVLQVSAKF
jgi:hypothetical protein